MYNVLCSLKIVSKHIKVFLEQAKHVQGDAVLTLYFEAQASTTSTLKLSDCENLTLTHSLQNHSLYDRIGTFNHTSLNYIFDDHACKNENCFLIHFKFFYFNECKASINIVKCLSDI